MGTVTITRKAKSLDAIAKHFEERGKACLEQANNCRTRRAAERLRGEADAWDSAAQFLLETTLVDPSEEQTK